MLANSTDDWNREREGLINKQKVLESRLNQLERRERRNNAIITGVSTTRESALIVVNGILAKLEQPVVADEAHLMSVQGASKVFVRFRNFDDNMKVLRQKKNLSSTNAQGECVPIYINEDMTKRDQGINFHARALAKKMRDLNKTVRMGVEKICIDGEWMYWDDESNNFISPKN